MTVDGLDGMKRGYQGRCLGEVVLTDDELFDLEEEKVSEEKEIDEIFRIETNIFDFETPLCNEFNGHIEWPTCNLIKDGYCNGGNLSGMIQVDAIHADQNCLVSRAKEVDVFMELDNNFDSNNDVSYYVDEEEERFKERKSKLLRMPYEKPPTFKSEKFRGGILIGYRGKAEEYVSSKEY
ncbi:hypothetical protein Tco_1379321 [Tanacetum coccineum]